MPLVMELQYVGPERLSLDDRSATSTLLGRRIYPPATIRKAHA
jgi:hypothetical protein